MQPGSITHMPEGFDYAEAAARCRSAPSARWPSSGISPRSSRGNSVLVGGASGGVGAYAVQVAKALGARVTAVTSTGNVDLVRSLGADTVVDYKKTDIATLGESQDFVFDTAGTMRFAKAKKVLKQDGHFSCRSRFPSLTAWWA